MADKSAIRQPKKKLTEKEKEVLKIVKDPVLWITQHIGKPRWYQELVLRHPHHRTVLRMGRRLGKCIAGGERILDPISGKYTSVHDLYTKGIQQPHLYTLEDKTTMSATNAFHIEDNGVKDVYEVNTVDGSRVKLTGNHPVLTKRGWVEVDDLKDNDELALPTKLPYTGSIYVTDEEIIDWVEHNTDFPEDIHEWQSDILEKFLWTYLQRYGLHTFTDKELLHVDGALRIEGQELSFSEKEEARKFKHLFLRIGYMTKIKTNWDKYSNEYILTIYGRSNEDVYYSPLESVLYSGKEQTYDVHVAETHNLVVEDIYVHNTWTMASHMMWVAMTNWGGRLADRKGLDILVVTPYDVQAKEIYDTLNKMIDESEALSSSLDFRRQGPPREIHFLNGNVIKLFTAGTSSSNNAASIRGQRADYVYLDEADYLSDGDYATIFPLTLEDPDNVGMMMSSTPTGKRGFFYKNAMEEKFNLDEKIKAYNTKELGYIYDTREYDRRAAEGFKEFHFPSYVSPHWDSKMEREMKSQFNAIEYEHEVLAEFGTEMEGVFSKRFVEEAASEEYSLQSFKDINAPVAIGVDYDKHGAQSNIIVLQYDPHDKRRVRSEMGDTEQETGYGRFKVINRIEIPKSENHYDLTVKRIIELDKAYQPFIIVPDAGSGEYQNEMLRKHIGEKVQPVFYGSRIDVRDPISRQIESKPMKPWLINQTNLLLERGQLRIPHKDIDETLLRQMLNFRVTKVTENGIPKYSSTDEHSLDAMVFALYGFMEKFPELINIVDAVNPARNAYVIKPQTRDPIKDRIKQVSEEKDSSNELKTHSSKARPNFARRGSSRNTNELSWGRRGFSSNKIRGRSF